MESSGDNLGNPTTGPPIVVIAGLSRTGKENFEELAFLSLV
jgi:hypothetical protein